jgi:hypothetical protein
MGRDGYGLLKVSPGHAMPYPFTPCGRATPETAIVPFLGWPTGRVACGRLRPLWAHHAVRLWTMAMLGKVGCFLVFILTFLLSTYDYIIKVNGNLESKLQLLVVTF